MGVDGTNTRPAPSDNPDWLIKESVLMNIKVDDLKTAIRRRGVVPKGKRSDLQNMLKEIVGKRMGSIQARDWWLWLLAQRVCPSHGRKQRL